MCNGDERKELVRGLFPDRQTYCWNCGKKVRVNEYGYCNECDLDLLEEHTFKYDTEETPNDNMNKEE